MRFCVLASGSSGNASLVEAKDGAVLLDLGLSPRQLEKRMAQMGLGWENLRAALLTHTHGDHWNEQVLAHLEKWKIPLFCHAEHARDLGEWSPNFISLFDEALVKLFDLDDPWPVLPSLHCRAFAVPHDGMTCGFRLETLDEPAHALAYAADLGSWSDAIIAALANADLLALEFNHDEDMQKTSGRSTTLIARNLGEQGHLSNHQAARLLRAILTESRHVIPQHLVQLHLSRQCNHPDLAQEAAANMLRQTGLELNVTSATQNHPGPWLHVACRTAPAETTLYVQKTLFESV